VVKEAVLKFVDENLRSNIHENTPIAVEKLPDGLRPLRPDIVFEREGKGGRVTEILEFSSPYGYMSHGGDILEIVSEQHTAKSSDLGEALNTLRQQPLNVTAVRVSLMGAVYPQSLKELRKILGRSRRETQKLGRRMSDAAIPGPFKIWCQYAEKMKREPTDQADEEAVIRQERRDAIEFDENEGEEEAEGIAKSGENLEEAAREKKRRNEVRPPGENHCNVDIRESEQRNTRGASIQGRAMRLGEIVEPATDEDTSDQLM
jgi:hypothetical protein